MAVMGRTKRAVAQGWNAKNKKRDQESKKTIEQPENKDKEKVTKEEHEARIKMLKELGLVK